MRIRSLVLLVYILLSSMLLLMNTDRASAQTDAITTAKNDLITAFQSIRTAQRQGASNTDLLPLINQLNTALQYEENATTLEQQDPTAADANAFQSINLSTNVSLQAQRLGDAAQTSSIRRIAFAYSIALGAATLAALAVVEAPRARRLIKKRQLRRARILPGEEEHAK